MSPDDATPTRRQICARTDPLGWRLILGVLTTHVSVPSLNAAVDAARAAVTGADISIAERISAALNARPGDDGVAPQTLEIAIDALDIAAIRPFWQAVTGYVGEPAAPDLPGNALLDPLRRGPAIWFQQMDAPRPQRNRIHLDVDVAPERAAARIEAAMAAGGTLVDDSAAPRSQ